jgi:hypothetical protein
MDLEACQKFLDDSGREAFLAEYQHDFSLIEEVRVIPEYNEALHVITWSDFARVYGSRHIPQHWGREVGFDAGFTDEHLSAWTWIATSAENSAVPGLRFRYRGMTFTSPLVDDMAEAAKRAMAPDSAARRYFDETRLVQRWVMSHEAKSVRDTLLAKHGLLFVPAKFGKTDGVDQWRHYLRVDKRQPHPFKPDEKLPDGTYRLGRSSFYDVVADDQLFAPRDDAGLKTHREQVLAWRWRPARLTESGLQVEQPVKAFDDTCDSTRMITSGWGPNPAPLTIEERIERQVESELGPRDERPGDPLALGPADGHHFGRLMKEAEIRRKLEEEEVGEFGSFWDGLA